MNETRFSRQLAHAMLMFTIDQGRANRAGQAGRVTNPGWNGPVFKCVGSSKLPVEKQKSGVIIAAEMVKGATEVAFNVTVAHVLPQRIKT